MFNKIASQIHLINRATKLYLDSNSTGIVYTHNGNGENSQKWNIVNKNGIYFNLQDVATSKFLQASGNGVITSTANGNDNQKWYFSGTNIINKANGRYLDSNSLGSVYTWPQNGGNNEKWQISDLSNI